MKLMQQEHIRIKILKLSKSLFFFSKIKKRKNLVILTQTTIILSNISKKRNVHFKISTFFIEIITYPNYFLSILSAFLTNTVVIINFREIYFKKLIKQKGKRKGKYGKALRKLLSNQQLK